MKTIIDEIKTYEDAVKATSCGTLDKAVKMALNGLAMIFKNHSGLFDNIYAYFQLVIIAKALNNGWRADWENGNQRKWYPWFEVSPSGFSFDDTACYSAPNAGVASRLCVKSEELAIYFGKQFIDIHKRQLMS